MSGNNDRLVQEIAFSNAKGICAATARELLDRVGGLANYFQLSQYELHNLVGWSSEIFIDAYRQQLLVEAQREADFVRSHDVDVLFLLNDDYPHRLADCEDAPVLLYRFGNCDLDKAHVISIVGTRNATPYGIDFTTNLVSDMASKVDDLLVVSGLAYGIDVASHKAALAADVPTVGVLADGFSHIYPADHKSVAAKMANHGGALLTEYPSDTRPHRSKFLARNRIIAGLSDCVIVIESDYRGGSMTTARIGLQYNREVLAVPGRVNDRYSRGTNKLISNHTASLIQCADDVIDIMGWPIKGSEKADEAPSLFRALSADEQDLIDNIKANPDATINELCVRCHKSYSVVSNILFQLELDDLITTLPGGRIALSTKIQY